LQQSTIAVFEGKQDGLETESNGALVIDSSPVIDEVKVELQPKAPAST